MSPLTTLGEQPMLQALFRKLRALADRRLPDHLREARRGEDLAYRYLSGNGYRIVARNYRSRSGKGEIDLVGWDQDRLAFIEVKTRASDDFGRPERAVDSAKQQHLVRSANDYLRRSKVAPGQARFRCRQHPPAGRGTRGGVAQGRLFNAIGVFEEEILVLAGAVVRVEGLHAAVRPHPRIERMTYFAARCSPAPSTCR